MQKQVFPQREQPQPSPVKAVFNRKLYLFAVIMVGIACALCWLMAILDIFTGGLSTSDIIKTILLSTLACINMLSYRSRMHLLEPKRQAAAQGDQRLLADEQPVPNALALPLPITISMRPRKSLLLAFSAIVLLVLLLAALAVLLPFSHAITTPQRLYWVFIYLIVVGVVPLIALVVFFVLYGNGRKQITLTEYGILHVDGSPKVQSIPWSEVRLFAISSLAPSASSQLQNQPPVFFELASPQTVIRWNWLRRKGSLFYPPSTSPAEYEQQMRAMLSVIKAKTGLPLYDLRKDL
ncbi:MAG TPA: hypothetical protein VFB12_08435 [Ktedonobacteraceae bacterium]|nr:hypothetical protein [Ktedonobacteraceae bacterium]